MEKVPRHVQIGVAGLMGLGLLGVGEAIHNSDNREFESYLKVLGGSVLLIPGIIGLAEGTIYLDDKIEQRKRVKQLENLRRVPEISWQSQENSLHARFSEIFNSHGQKLNKIRETNFYAYYDLLSINYANLSIDSMEEDQNLENLGQQLVLDYSAQDDDDSLRQHGVVVLCGLLDIIAPISPDCPRTQPSFDRNKYWLDWVEQQSLLRNIRNTAH